MKWTPWIKHTGTGRPVGLKDERRMQVLYLNDHTKELEAVSTRFVSGHVWDADTLAYRLEVVCETYVMYGSLGGKVFNQYYALGEDTHKIIYVIEDGEVISCAMEKL